MLGKRVVLVAAALESAEWNTCAVGETEAPHGARCRPVLTVALGEKYVFCYTET